MSAIWLSSPNSSGEYREEEGGRGADRNEDDAEKTPEEGILAPELDAGKRLGNGGAMGEIRETPEGAKLLISCLGERKKF